MSTRSFRFPSKLVLPPSFYKSSTSSLHPAYATAYADTLDEDIRSLSDQRPTMACCLLRQLCILIKKNFQRKLRYGVQTSVEMLAPFIFLFFTFILRVNPSQADARGSPLNVNYVNFSSYNSVFYMIGFAPLTKGTQELMQRACRLINRKYQADTEAIGFNSEYSMVDFTNKYPTRMRSIFAFDLTSSQELPKKLHIITRPLIHLHDELINTGQDEYDLLTLEAIMESFIYLWSPEDRSINISWYKFSVENFQTKAVPLLLTDGVYPLYFFSLYSFMIAGNVFLIAQERESGVLSLLQKTGASMSMYWLSWYISLSLVFLYANSFLIALNFIQASYSPIPAYTDLWMVIIYFTLLSGTISCYCILGSVLSSGAWTTSAIACCIFVGTAFPLMNIREPVFKKTLSYLFVVRNLMTALMHFHSHEQEANSSPSTLLADAEIYLSILVCGLVSVVLACIFYKINISDKSTFALISDFFKSKKCVMEKDKCVANMTEGSLQGLKKVIVVDKMCGGSQTHLHNITLDIYENRVTVLAGNSFSVSSLFSILTGACKPIKGSVTVHSMDLVKDIGAIRKITGLCPFHSKAFFPDFTVLETLLFFYQMKWALNPEDTPCNINEVLQMFELESVKNSNISQLKPAIMRLVQVAIPYLGNNQVLLFEHPTRYMDLFTRSKTWNIIRSHTEDRTVIISTTNLEEAQMVGDMTAFIAGSTLLCYGTTEFLSHLYGVGYNLIIEKTDLTDIHHIMHLVNRRIKQAEILENSHKHLVFLLPLHSTPTFYELFTELDKLKDSMGLSNYSVSAASLEEAILEKISDDAASSKSNDSEEKEPSFGALKATISSVRKYDQLFSRIYHSTNMGESEVDKEELEAESEVDEHELHVKPSSKWSNALFGLPHIVRNSGFGLLKSRFLALSKKKAVLGCCSFHMEFFQILLAFTLSYSLILADTTSAKPKSRMDIRDRSEFGKFLAHGTSSSQTREGLQTAFKNLFTTEETALTPEVVDISISNSDSWNQILMEQDWIGASFSVADNSSHFESIAWYGQFKLNGEALKTNSLMAVMNAFLHYFTNDSSQYLMHASRMPSGYSSSEFNSLIMVIEKEANFIEHTTSFLQALTLLLIPYFLILERKTGSKDLQLLSGTNLVLYWLVNFLFDFVTYIFLLSICPIVFLMDDLKDILFEADLLALVGFLNGVMLILVVYVLQVFFTSPAMGAFLITVINYTMGDIKSFLQMSLRTHSQHGVYDINYLEMFLFPWSIFPHYIFNLVYIKRMDHLCASSLPHCDGPLNNNIAKLCCASVTCLDGPCRESNTNTNWKLNYYSYFVLAAMVCQCLLWLLLLFLIESGQFRKLRHCVCGYLDKLQNNPMLSMRARRQSQEKTKRIKEVFEARDSVMYRIHSKIIYTDPGVTQEIAKIRQSRNKMTGNTVIRIEDVSLIEGCGKQESCINLQIKKGDLYCFVDLDKRCTSKLLKYLSGLEKPVTGTITVKGKSFKSYNSPPYTPIGYFMNKNAALPTMTGRETLNMYAILRGVKKSDVPLVVDNMLKLLNLTETAERHTENFREIDLWLLNIAMAFIGWPEIILMDDPFCHLDMLSKAVVLKALIAITQLGCTVIIGTDQIREISERFTVLAILMHGELMCVGSPDLIRYRYCNSYSLMARIDITNRNLPIESLISSLEQRFPSCQIFFDHQDFIHMRIPYEESTLPEIFSLMESAKKHLKLQSYLLTHTDLSNVVTEMEQRVAEEYLTCNNSKVSFHLSKQDFIVQEGATSSSQELKK